MRTVIFLSAALLLQAPPAPNPDDKTLFADDFRDGLSDQWQAAGLKKEDYRLRDGGLEMRVQPGPLTGDTPMLKVILPFTSAETVVASVKVTVLDGFTADHEFAGVYLLDETGLEFGAKKERVGGRLVFAPGRYRFAGRPGEEGDPGKYAVDYTPAAKDARPLRVVVDRGTAFFQAGPSADGRNQTFFQSALRREKALRGFGLAAAGAPAGADHWVRFEDFRVSRR
jgi:hypothetical protein